MNKYLPMFFSIILLLTPLKAFASEVPEQVQEAIQDDLDKFKPSLIDSGSFKLNNHQEAEQVSLSEGVRYFDVSHSKVLQSQENSPAKDFLESSGYIFSLNRDNESYGIVLTNDHRIVQASADFSFADEFEQAKRLAGYDENSILIYDIQFHITALVTGVEGQEVVVLLRKNGLFKDLQPMQKYSIEEVRQLLLANAKEIEAEKALEDPNEPRSGGGPSADSDMPPSSNTNDMSSVSAWSLSSLIFCAAAVVAAGWIAIVVFRNRRGHS